MTRGFYAGLARAAAARYPARDRFARGFAYGKLTRDPAFAYVLERGLVPPGARVLDLGSGQCVIAALLDAAGRSASNGWPAQWAPPPAGASVRAVELAKSDVERARACGCAAEVVQGDIRSIAFANADVCILLDVLHYLEPAAQDDVLRRARAALAGGGVLLARVADRSRPLRFTLTMLADRLATAMRGRFPAYHYRPLAAWIRALDALGFEVEPVPMSRATPFANVLLVARYDPSRCDRSTSPRIP